MKKIIERLFLTAGILFGSFMFFLLGYASGVNQLINISTTPQYDKGHAEKSLALSVNEQRTKNKLPALKQEAALNRSAEIRANEIARAGESAWQHVRPNGQSFDTAIVGWQDKYANIGENLVECAATNFEAVKAWMNSKTHKANILGTLAPEKKDWNLMGTARAWDAKNQCMIYVTHFARS